MSAIHYYALSPGSSTSTSQRLIILQNPPFYIRHHPIYTIWYVGSLASSSPSTIPYIMHEIIKRRHYLSLFLPDHHYIPDYAIPIRPRSTRLLSTVNAATRPDPSTPHHHPYLIISSRRSFSCPKSTPPYPPHGIHPSSLPSEPFPKKWTRNDFG